MNAQKLFSALPFKYFILGALFVAFAGCGDGYESTGGTWYYTSWNEGQGTVRKPLSVNGNEFVVLSYGYAKDDKKVFYLGDEIENAVASSFEVLDEYYSVDSSHVFFQGHEIPLASPASFERLGNLFGRDGKQIYCGTVPMRVARPESFRILQPNSMICSAVAPPIPVPESFGTFWVVFGKSVASDGVTKYVGPTPVEKIQEGRTSPSLQ